MPIRGLYGAAWRGIINEAFSILNSSASLIYARSQETTLES